MKFKKLLSGMLCLAMLASTCISATAAQITSASSQNVVISYNMDQSFLVVIPANFNLSDNKATADVSASNVLIPDSSSLQVTINGDDYVDSWELINEEESSDSLTYTIGSSVGGNDIINNSVVLSVGSGDAFNSTVSKTMYFTVIDTLSNAGTYRDTLTFTVNIVGGNGGSSSTPEVPENMVYYSSLSSALGDSGMTGDADSSTGTVCVYENSQTGVKTLQLQSNLALTETLNIEQNVILDLNGNEITTTATPAIRTQSADVVIDGTTAGSAIMVDAPAGQKGTVLSAMSGKLTVNGGTYIANTSGAGTSTNQTQVLYAYNGTTLNVSGATIVGTDTNNGSVNGITGKATSTLNVSNCNITVNAGESLENRGISTEGDAVIRNSTIIANADYVANAAGTNYASNSRGVWSNGALEMYDCYVYGAHAGVTVEGTVYIDGGTYEGYGHGGIYLSGTAGPHYFYNAKFNWAPMSEGTVADIVAGTNGAAFYVGGTSNQTAYFDNCDFNMNGANGAAYKDMTAPMYGIVFRTSGGEKNNIAYISNSYVEMATKVMFRGVGSNSHTIYNGVGNDWSKAKTIHSTNSTYFIGTNESYAK